MLGGEAKLEEVFGRRWGMGVLGSLWGWKGAKFVTLYRRLGASPGAMRETLDELEGRGWVARNPGYGHPMRPEYVLTEQGTQIGQACFDLMFLLPEAGSGPARSKWAMPVVWELRNGPKRFRELASALPAVTDRALAICLKRLVREGLVERRVEPTFPPSVSYGLSPEGRMLVQPLTDLVIALG